MITEEPDELPFSEQPSTAAALPLPAPEQLQLAITDSTSSLPSAPSDQTSITDPTPPPPSTDQPSPPDQAPVPGPSTSHANGFRTEKEAYHRVRERFNSGEPLMEACKKAGMGRATFYARRFIVEMIETDSLAFEDLVQSGKKTKPQLNKLCKAKLESSPYKRVYRNLKVDGKLLP